MVKPQSYTLSLIFNGLCDFLPSDDATGGCHVDWMTVLMADARQPIQGLPTHTPELVFPLSAQQGQGLKIPTNINAYVPLEGVDVFIDIEGQDPTGVDVVDGAVGERPYPGQEQYFSWVPKLEQVLPPRQAQVLGLGMPHGGYLTSDCLAIAPKLLTARIHLNYGRIFARSLVKVHNEVSVQQFSPSDEYAPCRQATAEAVQLDIIGISHPVHIWLLKFGTKVWRELVLYPQDWNHPTTISFNNVCCGDEGKSGVEEEPSRDADFVLHYRLALGAGVDLLDLPAPVPVRFAARKIMGDGGGLFKRCTQAQSAPLLANEKKEFEDTMMSLWHVNNAVRRRGAR